MASRKLTLVFTLTLLTLFALLNTPVTAAPNYPVKRQDTGSGSDQGLGIINIPDPQDGNNNNNKPAAGDNNAAGASGNGAAASANPTDTAAKGGASNAANGATNTAAAGQQSSDNGGLLGGVGSILDTAINGLTSTSGTSTSTTSGTASASTTSSSSSSSTTSSSSSGSSTGTPTPTPTPPAKSSDGTVETIHQTVDTTTTEPSAAQQTPAAADANANANNLSNNKKGKGTMTIIIIASIAGGVGLIALVWTIFRKMKLGTSKEFDDRLNPIDWQPHAEMGDGPDMAQLRRQNSNGANSIRNNISDLPNHDFTAGPAAQRGLAPVGGYAELHRGPSPVPSDPYARVNAATARGGYGAGPYGGY